ncbi:hypothetical protein PROFUN_10064 [Planoprotostelium fungivorum]|uniref:Uncharacterized protein n=1 Tax=Planoprotostelium fungivorum TaxID=1890364 RepID=A0A2P6NEV1_9EUKA|nr:hypothetical protein PROFUN_10064 [Planoprotostelium fungivorum]
MVQGSSILKNLSMEWAKDLQRRTRLEDCFGTVSVLILERQLCQTCPSQRLVNDDEEFVPEASGKKVVKNSTVSPSATLVKVPPRVSPPLDTESIMGAGICQYTSVANNPVTTWTTIDDSIHPALLESSTSGTFPQNLVSKCMKHQDNRYAAAYLQPYLTENVITRDKLVSPKDAAFLMIKIRFSPVESRY